VSQITEKIAPLVKIGIQATRKNPAVSAHAAFHAARRSEAPTASHAIMPAKLTRNSGVIRYMSSLVQNARASAAALP